MSTPRTEAERFQALAALAELLGGFSDQGLRTLARAAEDGRLVRGQWRGSGGQLRTGCPLSCADGVLGGATAFRFAGRAYARNRFIAAWDRGLLSPADVTGLALAELEWRERRPVPLPARAAARLRAWARLLTSPVPRLRLAPVRP
jgi:hypothetical protein